MSVSTLVAHVGLEKFGFRASLIKEKFSNIYVYSMVEIVLGRAENPPWAPI